MDPANQGKWRVRGPRRDWSKAAAKEKQEAYHQMYKDADMSLLSWSVELDD